MSSRMVRRARRIRRAAIPALVTVLVLPQTALADEFGPSAAPASTVARVPMTVVGYDAEVAEANGYRIVTGPDGSQASVPVTNEATAQEVTSKGSEAGYASAHPAKFGVVDGDCGSSWINAVKEANDTVAYSTGFVVWGAVVDAQWKIVAQGFVSGNSVTLHPGPGSGAWQTEGSITDVVGPGIAGVASGASFAVLASGEVCSSGGPTANFG